MRAPSARSTLTPGPAAVVRVQFHESVERLRSDPAAWAAYRAESKELDATLADGLEPDEDWSFLLEAKPEEIEFRDPHAANAIQDTGRATQG